MAFSGGAVVNFRMHVLKECDEDRAAIVGDTFLGSRACVLLMSIGRSLFAFTSICGAI